MFTEPRNGCVCLCEGWVSGSDLGNVDGWMDGVEEELFSKKKKKILGLARGTDVRVIDRSRAVDW